MYIESIDEKNKALKIAVPLIKGTGKARIKQRRMIYDYGLPVPTRRQNITQDCYVEWQIGYDVVTNEEAKMKLTTLQDSKFHFKGANTKNKTLYELSEYLYYFTKWKVIKKQQLEELKKEIISNTEDLLDVNKHYAITRSHPVEKELYNIKFEISEVRYPLFIHRFVQYDIIAEIIIKEKQYAIGTQPMLYFCFPVTELETTPPIIGRTANYKEFGYFILNKNNIEVCVEMLKIFSILSQNHKFDILQIIDKLLIME